MKSKIHSVSFILMLIWMTGADSDNFATWCAIMCALLAVTYITKEKE